MNIFKVSDHKKFACFEYENSESDKIELGQIVFKMPDILSDEKPEIGIIIQVHPNDEFRTDMWGNSDFSDLVKPATLKQIQRFRPQILEDIEPCTLLEIRADGYGYIISKPTTIKEIESLQKLITPANGYELQIIPVSEAQKNSKLIGQEYLDAKLYKMRCRDKGIIVTTQPETFNLVWKREFDAINSPIDREDLKKAGQ